MEIYYEEFRKNLKYYREQKGWSQSELAIQANSSNGQIGNIESGKAFPSFDLLIRLSKALSVNPADFFLRDASKIENIEKFTKHIKLIDMLDHFSLDQQKVVEKLISEFSTDKYHSPKK